MAVDMTGSHAESVAVRLARGAGLACLSLALILTGCTGKHAEVHRSAHTATTDAPAAAECAITAATSDGIPAGISQQGYTAPVYGREDLWVGAWWLDTEALNEARTKGGLDGEHPYSQKYPTWTVRNGEVSDAGGVPRVSVRRLDKPGNGSSAVGGYASAPMDDGTVARWWPTVVGFTTRGCWRVTETAGDDSLSYTFEL